MDVIFILLGLTLLVVGGEALVRGAVDLARRLGLPELFIGLVLVGLGAAAPELAASIEAALRDRPALVFGAAAGSSIANLLLVVGLAALIRPIETPPRALLRDAIAAALAVIAFGACVLAGPVTTLAGAALVGGLIGYIGVSWVGERGRAPAPPEAPHAPIWLALLFAGAGLGFTILGARALVEGVVRYTAETGAPDSLVGLTIVGLGTSLPELTAALIAALRGRGGLALGTALGAVIYNVFAVLGITALVRPLDAPADLASLDLWVLAGALAAVLGAASFWRVLNRRAGLALLVAYAGYLYWLWTRLPA